MKKRELLRFGPVLFVVIFLLATLAHGKSFDSRLLLVLPIASVPFIYWKAFRYVSREDRRAELMKAGGSADALGNDDVIYSMLASLTFFNKAERDDFMSDFPSVRLRQTPMALVTGNLSAVKLEIRRSGLYFKIRPWPLSFGARGTVYVGWSGIGRISVGDPYQGMSTLGGHILAELVGFKTPFLSFEFFGSQAAVKVAFTNVGRPPT
jgi:hypothetical protein